MSNFNNLINYRYLSRFLTGKDQNIRKGLTPKKHAEALKELFNFLEYWQNKYK